MTATKKHRANEGVARKEQKLTREKQPLAAGNILKCGKAKESKTEMFI